MTDMQEPHPERMAELAMQRKLARHTPGPWTVELLHWMPADGDMGPGTAVVTHWAPFSISHPVQA